MTTTTTFPPTPEQLEVLRLAKTGGDLVIQAGAGTGKTTALKQIAVALPQKRIQYIAFNSAIVRDSKASMPPNVRCNTAHSLAMREVGRRYDHRLPAIRMRPTELSARLGAVPVRVQTADGNSKQISATYIAGLAVRACRQFCNSADAVPTDRHVPYVDGIDLDGSFENNNIVAAHALPLVKKVWADWANPQGVLPYDHAAYLKKYQLSNPRLHVDVVLFDECQDASPVMLSIVWGQTHAQRIYVGDSAQQIYGFTGAVNALEQIEAQGCQVAYLSQSFRFGPAVAEQANIVLSMIPDTPLRLKGSPAIQSRVEAVEEPRAILTRTNATAVRHVLLALEAGRKPCLVGGAGEIVRFARAAERLQRGESADHPELGCFDSWAEVQRYVEEDELGGDLKLMVSLIDEFGIEKILEALDNTIDPKREDLADLIVSTAHKSKGREWETVQLGADFPEDNRRAGPEELRLLYVACTRARLALDITSVGLLAVPVPVADATEGVVVRLGGQHEMPSSGEPISDAELAAARAAVSAPDDPEATGGSSVAAPAGGPEKASERVQRGKREKVWISLDSPAEAAIIDAMLDVWLEDGRKTSGEDAVELLLSDDAQALIGKIRSAVARQGRS